MPIQVTQAVTRTSSTAKWSRMSSTGKTASCVLCPRACRVDRATGGIGFCGAGEVLRVAKACLHRWEEPCISGTRGSGTVFFSHCNLRCIFCQNWEISQKGYGRDITPARLAEICLELQGAGAHNVNLVSPTPWIPQIVEALDLARAGGLTVPVVYNSNGFDSPQGLSALRGLVDVYLPDLKYVSDEEAQFCSGASGYFHHATQAILAMLDQVGEPVFDDEGLIRRGLIVRHLVLPGGVEDSKRVIDWIAANLPYGVYVSLMAQYTPMYLVASDPQRYPRLARPVTAAEYDEVADYFLALGLENGFVQEPESVGSQYTPDFYLQGV